MVSPDNAHAANRFPQILRSARKKAAPCGAASLQKVMRRRYGRLGACAGGVRPGIVLGAGALVCGGEAWLLATRVGSCPTPKARASTMTRKTAPAIQPQL